jgi:myo-inositol-1(or 4)-monophosphatase
MPDGRFPELESELLAVAHRAAWAAGSRLLEHWRRGIVELRSKSSPTDPVSEADLAAEAAIREVLGRERPGDAILGEEGGSTPGDGSTPEIGGSGSAVSGLRWVVDPLDGTVNYLYGIARFGVSIACEDADGALVGVVLDPIGGESVSATRSGPALRSRLEPGRAASHDGEPVLSSNCDDLARALVATGFAYHPEVREAQGRVVTRLLPQIRDLRRAGAASLDLVSCASGEVDAYFERGVKAWDIAAGGLICARAGLVVRPLAEVQAAGANPALPEGVVVAPPALIDQLEELVSGPPPGVPI